MEATGSSETVFNTFNITWRIKQAD